MQRAIFINLDNTLITTVSGRVFSLHSDDWRINTNLLDFLLKYLPDYDRLIIVSNQDAIALGEQTMYGFNRMLENICRLLENNLKIASNSIAYTYCINKGDFRYMPNPGMAYEMALEYEIDLSQSIMIGSSLIHEQFSKKANIKQYIYLTNIGLVKL
jgi:D-glycero-D-manno-heptose 1,7-bisphosphate phosphatase